MFKYCLVHLLGKSSTSDLPSLSLSLLRPVQCCPLGLGCRLDRKAPESPKCLLPTAVGPHSAHPHLGDCPPPPPPARPHLGLQPVQLMQRLPGVHPFWHLLGLGEGLCWAQTLPVVWWVSWFIEDLGVNEGPVLLCSEVVHLAGEETTPVACPPSLSFHPQRCRGQPSPGAQDAASLPGPCPCSCEGPSGAPGEKEGVTWWRRESRGEELSCPSAGASSPGIALPSWATLGHHLNSLGLSSLVCKVEIRIPTQGTFSHFFHFTCERLGGKGLCGAIHIATDFTLCPKGSWEAIEGLWGCLSCCFHECHQFISKRQTEVHT